MVCKLIKALYYFKQAPRLWYKRLSKFLLKKLGFKQINIDYSIFVTLIDINVPIVSIFVNNIKVMAIKGLRQIKNIIRQLVAVFKVIDMGLISFYLGLRIKKN